MTKEWEEKQKPGSDSLSGKLNSASNKEVDRSAAYGPSLGYGDLGYGDLGYGPSLEEKANSLQPTGTRRSANFSRITAAPSDELATPTKDGKPLVKENFKNDDLTNNNKHASKGDDKSPGGDFQENLISTTFLAGENYIIEVPAGLKVDDPRFTFEIQVKILVEQFNFEVNDARELIKYLSQQGLSTGINVVGYSAKKPDGRRVAAVNASKDTANYYRKEAAYRRQRKVNAQREQQRLDVQRKQELSNLRQSYVKGLRQYSSDVRNHLNQLFLSLSAEHRQNIEAKTDELYRKIESSDLNLELREAIRIAVMNQWFRPNVEKILNGKPPAPNPSRPAATPPQNKNTRPPSSNLKQPATSQPRQSATNQPRQPAANQPRQPAANQPRQLGAESNNDRTRWQATARSFQEQFATNYSREQIIVIQRLVGATPDGNYGEETAQKVYQWQQNHRVPNPDGLVGDVTHRAMVAQLRTTNTAAADILSPQQKAPPPPIAAPTNPVRNATDSRTQLEAFSPAIKTLLSRQETSQTENYPQLLRVGNKLQQLPPEEFEYIYQPFASNLAGDLTGLERSIDIFTNTRSQVIAELQSPGRTYLGQRVNTTLFGEKPLTSNPAWQQVLKDLIASVLQSPNHAPEILGEVFDFLKEHWVQFVGLTVALIGAQASVAALTGIPEPTFLSKVLAVALQGFILAVYGVGIVVSVEGTIDELMNWWNAASTANGNPEQIASASRAFLRMVGNLTLLIISSKQFQDQLKPEKLARLQAMLNRRQQMTRLPNTHEGSTIDLVPDPANPNSYVYRLQPNPNAQKLPPSSSPSIDITNQTPPAPRPSGGGGSGIIPTRPASIPSTSPTTPGRSTPPASTGQITNPEQTLPQQVQQPQVPDTSPPPVTDGPQLTPPTSSSPVTNPNQTTFADPPQPQVPDTSPPPTTDEQLVVPSSQSTAGVEQPSTQQHQPTGETSQPSTP
ncbi:peptidoglycan-binding protein, partial [Microcoleus sp. herbarium5]|uniref:peptidoglycan-binding protein n=1 Tax=Microcoleus sp. herbarium5 TaxID=3055434 RepID=UPI002FD3B485